MSSPPPSTTPDPDRTIRIAKAVNYPNRAWFCIAGFIALVSIVNLFSRFHNPRYRAPRGPIVWSRLPAATANAFRAIVFRSTLQFGSWCSLNLAELCLTAAYATLLFVWSLVNTTNTLGMKYDPKYWANIASSVATTQLPLVAALGSKNNIIAFFTGVSYEKLNYLHRMAARVLCVLIWVHAAGRIKIGLVGPFSERIPWVHCGALAATAFTLLCLVSVHPLRKRNYEFFLVAHMLLVSCVPASISRPFSLTRFAASPLWAPTFTHEASPEGKHRLSSSSTHPHPRREQDHIWPTFIVWALDRTLRLIRILVYNTAYFKKGSRAQLQVRAPNFVRVTLQRPAYLHWQPGQSAYLRIPGAFSTLFESHPFTIASIDAPPEVTKLDDIAKEEEADHTVQDGKSLSFIIGVRSGFTQRLLRAIAVEGKHQMKVIFEGPYGSPPRLDGFGTVVLIADCIDWIVDAIRPATENVPSHLTVDIRIYVTGAKINSDEKACGWDSPGVDVIGGRPDLKQLVKDVISQDQTGGAIAFTVCGSSPLTHAVRSALRSPRFFDVLRGGPTVVLHVESFGM
ncbi:hypothetical protein H0H92_000516 [Tricholoma furcatifolium]|nr:hypothetical protein H0H92_000516 [Tricholoma furcatifolium]